MERARKVKIRAAKLMTGEFGVFLIKTGVNPFFAQYGDT
jgi:hypothetical protein